MKLNDVVSLRVFGILPSGDVFGHESVTVVGEVGRRTCRTCEAKITYLIAMSTDQRREKFEANLEITVGI